MKKTKKTVSQKTESYLEGALVKNAPELPKFIKEVIVKILPWLSLLMAILFVKQSMFLGDAFLTKNPDSILSMGFTGFLVIAFNAVLLALMISSAVLSVVAFFKMEVGERDGWFLTPLPSIVATFILVDVFIKFDVASLGSWIIVLVFESVVLYLLYQVKKYYKN